jgi:hypothetical protein
VKLKVALTVFFLIPFVAVILLTQGAMSHNGIEVTIAWWILGIVMAGGCVGLVAAPIVGVWKGK